MFINDAFLSQFSGWYKMVQLSGVDHMFPHLSLINPQTYSEVHKLSRDNSKNLNIISEHT